PTSRRSRTAAGRSPSGRRSRGARAKGSGSRPGRRCTGEARPAHGRVPGALARGSRRMGVGRRLRGDRDRVLARRRAGRAALLRRVPPRRRDARRGRGPRDPRPARAPRPHDLLARVLPEQPPPRRRGPRGGERAPSQGRARGAAPRRRRRRDLRRPRSRAARAAEPRARPPGLAAARPLRRRPRRADRDRELPDDLQPRRVARRDEPRLLAGALARALRDRPGRELRPQPRSVAPRLADDRRRARGARVRAADLPRPREGPRDRPGRPVRARRHVGGPRLAGAANPGPRRGALGPVRRRPLPLRLRRRRQRRARGPWLRGRRRAGSARLRDRVQDAAPADRVKPCSPVVLGLDFGGTKIAVSVADRAGRRLGTTVVLTAPERGARRNLERGVDAARALLRDAAPDAALAGVGASTFGIPGPDGIRLAPAIPGWEELALEHELRRALACPHVRVANDVKAAATAELRLGALRGCGHGIYVNLGTGLAAALVAGGEVVLGANGAAGEIGYSLVD